MSQPKNALPMVLAVAAGIGAAAYFLLLNNDSVEKKEVADVPGDTGSRIIDPAEPPETSTPTTNPAPPTVTPPAPTPPSRPDLPPPPAPGNAGSQQYRAQLQQIDNLPANEQYAARRKLLAEWVAVDPSAAVQALEQIPEDHRAGTLSAVAHAWGKVEPEAAAAWALELPQADSVRALAASVTGWFQVDRVAAKAYATELEPGPYRTEILKSMVANWAGPPRSAAEWLGTLQEGTGRNQALSSIFSQWGRTSPAMAEAWVMQSPHGNLRDHATVGLSRGLLTRDPGKALRYAQQIEDTGVKTMQLRSMVNDYARTCISCHRSGKPGCLREPVSGLPEHLVPAQQKSRVFNIVRRNLPK